MKDLFGSAFHNFLNSCITDELNPVRDHCLFEDSSCVWILPRHNPAFFFEHRHLAPESSKSLGQLATDGARSDNSQSWGQCDKLENGFIG